MTEQGVRTFVIDTISRGLQLVRYLCALFSSFDEITAATPTARQLRSMRAAPVRQLLPRPLHAVDWPAKVTTPSAGRAELNGHVFVTSHLRTDSLYSTDGFTEPILTLRGNDKYPKIWYFVKRPYWRKLALELKCALWKFEANWTNIEQIIAKN